MQTSSEMHLDRGSPFWNWEFCSGAADLWRATGDWEAILHSRTPLAERFLETALRAMAQFPMPD